jgi:cytochrome c-type biogenesis protein CcsB
MKDRSRWLGSSSLLLGMLLAVAATVVAPRAGAEQAGAYGAAPASESMPATQQVPTTGPASRAADSEAEASDLADAVAQFEREFTLFEGDLSLDVSPLRNLSVNDRQTVKTLDTWARQSLTTITGKSRLDGKDPLFTVLDMAIRPSVYASKNIIRIRAIPLRKDLQKLPGLSLEEGRRILEEGTVSLNFLLTPQVQSYLVDLQNSNFAMTDAISQVQLSMQAMQVVPSVIRSEENALLVVPPNAVGGPWRSLTEMAGSVPELAAVKREMGHEPAPAVEGYDLKQTRQAIGHFSAMVLNWQSGKTADAQKHINGLADALPLLRPSDYPSQLKRRAEVIYNRSHQLTWPGAAFYFIAFVLFLISARARSLPARRWATGFMLAGFVVHTAGVAIRWWLVEKSTDDWFHSIPIKNQFESVMMAAWLGMIVVGIGGMFFKGYRNLTGAAATFWGWLAMIALFTVPYVFNKEIGGQITQVNGILMSYYLYIHVTLAVFSYALIGMSFLLSLWWLIKYVINVDLVDRLSNPRQLSADAVDDNDSPETEPIEHAALFASTAAVGAPALAMAGGAGLSQAAMQVQPGRPTLSSFRSTMARLDACNLVILQLAFWVLGLAIVLGAVWADVSWGRPWGWDPKETFALVTWICYLIIVHARFATANKAFWTAILSIIGFVVMLFNWIGVNYFLVGLHSYA